jgi:NADH-quinone oxidoreductase subunit J
MLVNYIMTVFLKIILSLMLTFSMIVCLSPNRVVAAVSLLLIYIFASILSFLIGYSFIGVILLIIYAGAISIILLFIFMMLGSDVRYPRRRSANSIFISAIFLVIFYFVLLLVFKEGVLNFPSYSTIYPSFDKNSFLNNERSLPLSHTSITLLGIYLYTFYHIVTILGGFFLLTALIGVIFTISYTGDKIKSREETIDQIFSIYIKDSDTAKKNITNNGKNKKT